MKALPRLMIGFLFAGALALPAQPGCDGLPDSGPPVDQCKVSEGHVVLPDNWTITSLTGDGSRQGCTEEAYNKDYEFELSQPIHMTQTFVDGQPQFTGAVGEDFQVLDGSISGRCISFKTEETTSTEVIYRTFSGVFDEYGETFSGSFTGLGPTHCDVHGNFRAVVE